jgi:hypothetical protein
VAGPADAAVLEAAVSRHSGLFDVEAQSFMPAVADSETKKQARAARRGYCMARFYRTARATAATPASAIFGISLDGRIAPRSNLADERGSDRGADP